MKPLVLLADPFACSTWNTEQLDETVKQVRQYLKGKHQVIDYGQIGLFRVYSVREITEDFIRSTLRYLVVRQHKDAPEDTDGSKEVAAWLSKIHTLADYQKAIAEQGTSAPYSKADTALHNVPALRRNIQKASDAILGLGIPRQTDVLILLDLSMKVNQITGGGVGGYAYKSAHAIEFDVMYMLTDHGVSGLVHEWGHKKFFHLPQHVTKFVREWFTANVTDNPEIITANKTVDERTKLMMVKRGWTVFSERWRKNMGLDPAESIASYKRALADEANLNPSSIGRIIDTVTRGPSDVILYGHIMKSMRNPEGGRGLRKGETARCLSAQATGPDMFQLLVKQAGSYEVVKVDRKTLLDVFEIDFGLTVKHNPKGTVDWADIHYKAGQIKENNPLLRLVMPRAVLNGLDDVFTSITEYLRGSGFDPGSNFYPSDDTLSRQFMPAWISRVNAEQLDFDPEKAFMDLFPSVLNWEWADDTSLHRAKKLGSPEGKMLRDAAFKLGITPSSYAGANVDELWAEVVERVALRPNEVPKALRLMLRDAIQGKTPGPGARVKGEALPWHTKLNKEKAQRGGHRRRVNRARSRAPEMATSECLEESAVDLVQQPEWNDVFFADPSAERIAELRAWLKKNRSASLRLYHGTSARHDIMGQGLLPTSASRRLSLQSGSGYVYLSVYPDMARTFAKMGYPRQDIVVYAVEVPISELKPDADQLRNKRQWANVDMGSDLAASLAVGHGARVKGKVLAHLISKIGESMDEAYTPRELKRLISVDVDSIADLDKAHKHMIRVRDYRNMLAAGQLPMAFYSPVTDPGGASGYVPRDPMALHALGYANEIATKRFEELRKARSECLEEDDDREVTKDELNGLERQLDKLFKSVDIDVQFTKHFLDRLNDERNGKQITISELRRVFTAVWKEHGDKLRKANVDWEAVIRDLPTAINIPVVIDMDRRSGDAQLVSKTIMRKRKFQTGGEQLRTTSKSESSYPNDPPKTYYHPTNSLGIPRKKMPQIVGAHMEEFLQWLEDKGITHERVSVPVQALKPTQEKMSDVGVDQVRKAPGRLRPVLASNDNYIIDGHHRWLQLRLDEPKAKMELFRVNLPARKLIEVARTFPKVVYREAVVLLDRDPFLLEGVDDQHVLKAVFLAGGGGSGKGFIGSKTFGDSGLRTVNSDQAFEYTMRKHGLSLKTDVGSDDAQKLRPHAKTMTTKKQEVLLKGRTGIIIDGTADDPAKIKTKKAELEAMGYDCSMMFVDVALDVALARNQKRERVVPEEIVRETHEKSQKAKTEYAKLFGDKFANVENSKILSDEELRRDLVPKLARIAKKLIDGPVENPIGRKWIKSQLAPGEKHKALAEPRATKQKPEGKDGNWRTLRNGARVFFDPQGKPTKGNPHALAAMKESVALLDRNPFVCPA